MSRTLPSQVNFIHLGTGGEWKPECIEQKQRVMLGFDDVNHQDCRFKKWDAVRKHFLKSHDESKATGKTNEVKAFYESDESALWITFYEGFLWWCRAREKVTRLKGGRKIRQVIGKWRNTNLVNEELRIEDLDKCLTKKRGWPGTLLVLKGKEEDCALRKLLGVTKSDGKYSGKLSEMAAEKNEGDYFNPKGLKDERKRCLREIVERRGREAFRNRLIEAYNERCAITKCDAVAALEAAHIIPHKGTATDKTQNGLLLRGDIHTLFDLDLIGVHPKKRTIHLHPMLKKTSYKNLQGKPLHEPADINKRPNETALAKRWKQFENACVSDEEE